MAQLPPNSPEEIKTRKVELVLQQLESLPTLPAVVVRLLTLTGSNESKIQEVVQLLSADQSLTGKLLSLASSASIGVRAPVTSVHQAVVLLGFDTVRNLALSVKVFETFQQRPPGDGETAETAASSSSPPQTSAPPAAVFDRAEFWKHSLAVATAAEMLAARCKPRLNTADALVCGLLHDIGKVAFDTAMPKSFARVVEMAALMRGDIADVERRVIGLDHALAGKRLAEAWNLPQLITQTIWLHGTPPMSVSPGSASAVAKATGLVNTSIIHVVGLADLLVRRQHIGFSGNFLFPYEVEQFTQVLGLTVKDVDEVTAQLAEALEVRARAIGLYDVESRQVYLESIANANAELGRVNQQLAVQNRRLSMRSSCFEMLTRFYQRIVPAASPAQLLTEIGQVAHQFFDSTRLILFSQDPDQGGTIAANATGGAADDTAPLAGIGEVLTFDPTQTAQDSFLMHMPLYAGDQRLGRPNQNFIRPAAPQLDWLLERVRGFLGTAQCWFMPLLCSNEPVGGIMWIARDGSNSLSGVADLLLVSQSWGMTLRTAQIREQQTILTESLAAANRELGALQQQLVRARSLASLGEMAAGAAHEMNNPLAVISGRAQLLAARITDSGMKHDATLIAQQGERLSQIITDMMEFAKPVTPRMGPLNVAAVLDDAVKMAVEKAAAHGLHTPAANATAGTTAGAVGGNSGVGSRIRLEPVQGIPAARGDARQIRNALAEVILNALQATRGPELDAGAAADPDGHVHRPHSAHGGGEVHIQARFDPLDQQIVVQVTDRGSGMSDEVLRNAFSPFFSAKSAGRNRGMGLAKALRWIENHGGTIRLDSSPGAGTTAVIIFPQNPVTGSAGVAGLAGHVGSEAAASVGHSHAAKVHP